MEPITLSLLPIVVNKLLSKNKSEKGEALLSLKKLFLVECRINLKILDIADNNKIEDSDKFKLLSKLNNEASSALFSYVDYSVLKKYFKKLGIKTDDGLENDILLVSIISKIELLKILSSALETLSQQRIVIIKSRINHLYKQLIEIVSDLNTEG